MTNPTPDLSALITSLQERDAVWKRERTQWPPGISDEAKQHHYAEIGKNVEPHLPSFLALSRWSLLAKENLEVAASLQHNKGCHAHPDFIAPPEYDRSCTCPNRLFFKALKSFPSLD